MCGLGSATATPWLRLMGSTAPPPGFDPVLGLEISQILTEGVESWQNVRRVCKKLTQMAPPAVPFRFPKTLTGSRAGPDVHYQQDLIAASIHDTYSVGLSIRPIYTR